MKQAHPKRPATFTCRVNLRLSPEDAARLQSIVDGLGNDATLSTAARYAIRTAAGVDPEHMHSGRT